MTRVLSVCVHDCSYKNSTVNGSYLRAVLAALLRFALLKGLEVLNGHIQRTCAAVSVALLSSHGAAAASSGRLCGAAS